MLGLQGKCLKPGSTQSVTGSNSRMASRSRASSSSSDKPEKLSFGPSPYASKPSVSRRVQSAASSKRTSLGPNIKASELFRKNSEPVLTKRVTMSRQSDDNKNKHVRIEETRSNSQYSSDTSQRRPFSFSSSSNRSRSTSLASNDSMYENIPETLIGSGLPRHGARAQWRRDSDNNNGDTNRVAHPRLSKRSYSMDTTDDYGTIDHFPQIDFRPTMMQMKITEHPDEGLGGSGSGSARSNKSRSSIDEPVKDTNLNRTFNKGEKLDHEGNKIDKMSPATFDRLLLMHTDNILQDASEFIHEMETDPVKQVRVKESEEKVDELSTKVSTMSMSPEKKDTPKHSLELSFEGRFNTLELSGIELSDITCPQQVMEQSVPNSSRERPGSGAVVKMDIIAEANKYRLEMQSGNKNDSFDSESSAQNLFETDHDEIQRKVTYALQLLEAEETKVSNAWNNFNRPSTVTRAQVTSPFVSVSNPNSRPSSRGGGSCRSSPRIRSEERNVPYTTQSHTMTRENYGPASYQEEPRHGSSTLTLHREMPSSGSRSARSARSCSCLMDQVSNEPLNSARSSKTTVEPMYGRTRNNSDTNKTHSRIPRPNSGTADTWDTKDNKTKQIFSFLDEVEKSDQEILFGLRFDTDSLGRPKPVNSGGSGGGFGGSDHVFATSKQVAESDTQFRTMEHLVGKSSIELAREVLMLERKVDEGHHTVKLLEESLLNQRELNIRNLRNSERDFKKRLKMQKEEFDLLFSRNEGLINSMAAEKRMLQEKLDKLCKTFDDMEEKYKEQHKSVQQKHLDEIRRLRKMQQNAENSLKHKLAGNKAQASEIREMTVKGLEPEVQRIIARHQKEMQEMRAWHSDEMRETEERFQRKLHMQLEDMREKFSREKEEVITREREAYTRRLEAEQKLREEEIDSLKRKYTSEIFEERERAVSEEMRLKDSLHDSMRKSQIKSDVEIDNLKQEYETKLSQIDRRHESELKSVKDVYEAEKHNWAANQCKKLEQSFSEKEASLRESLCAEKDKEWKEKEKKLKEDFENVRKEDEVTCTSRYRRMQEKLQSELEDMEKSEKDLKSKLTQAKSDLLAKEEELFSYKASGNLKEKQLIDLQEINMKMQEERVNLTSVIRREFTDQIAAIDSECRNLKASIVEIQSNCKLQLEQKQLEIEKVIVEKDGEIEKIGMRVKQTLARKDETILELQKQVEKCSFQMTHLEQLLEEQRREFIHSMKMPTNNGGSRKK